VSDSPWGVVLIILGAPIALLLGLYNRIVHGKEEDYEDNS